MSLMASFRLPPVSSPQWAAPSEQSQNGVMGHPGKRLHVMTSSWFTMSTTRSPSIQASLKYQIFTSCSKLSQLLDIISHVKYLNLLRKSFQDSSKFRIVLFFMICHTYYAHTLVPCVHTKELMNLTLNSQQYTVSCQYMTTFQKRRICGAS